MEPNELGRCLQEEKLKRHREKSEAEEKSGSHILSCTACFFAFCHGPDGDHRKDHLREGHEPKAQDKETPRLVVCLSNALIDKIAVMIETSHALVARSAVPTTSSRIRGARTRRVVTEGAVTVIWEVFLTERLRLWRVD